MEWNSFSASTVSARIPSFLVLIFHDTSLTSPFLDDGVYVNTNGELVRDAVLQWGETPYAIGELITNVCSSIYLSHSTVIGQVVHRVASLIRPISGRPP